MNTRKSNVHPFRPMTWKNWNTARWHVGPGDFSRTNMDDYVLFSTCLLASGANPIKPSG